jgi:hypothetical protein
MIGKKVTEQFLAVVWLMESVLGKYTKEIVYNNQKEKYKKILCDVYWYSDSYEVFPPEWDNMAVERFMDTVFRYNNIQSIDNNDLIKK